MAHFNQQSGNWQPYSSKSHSGRLPEKEPVLFDKENYFKRTTKETPFLRKQQAQQNQKKNPLEKVQQYERRKETVTFQGKEQRNLSHLSTSHRFVPTYIPQALNDKQRKAPLEVNQEELFASMKKEPSSYLLFSKATWTEEILSDNKATEIIPKSLIEEVLEPEKTMVKEEVVTEPLKKATTKKRKKSALDKSLKGIFEEEQTPFFNRYFEKD